MSDRAIDEAISETNSQEKLNRPLPTHLIIALIIGLNWWSKDLVVDVLKNLVQGLSISWIPKGIKWKTPSKSSISEARQRIGCAVMTRLFEETSSTNGNNGNTVSFFGRITMDGNRWNGIRYSLTQKKMVRFLAIQEVPK